MYGPLYISRSRDPLHVDNVPQLKCSEDREHLDEERDAEENGNQGYQPPGKKESLGNFHFHFSNFTLIPD